MIMTIQQSDITAMFALFDDAESQFLEALSSFSENETNIVPFEDSWTAAQVVEHVGKSNSFVEELLRETAKPADRKPDARVQEIKEMFLDFTLKFKSAKSILPAKQIYNKEKLIEEVKISFKHLKEAGSNEDLSESFEVPKLGEMTKFEMLYLTVFHTRRHEHQLKNIYQILQKQLLIR